MSVSANPDPRDAFFQTDDLTGRVAREAGNASVWILIFVVAKLVVQFGSIAILSRLVPPDEFGVFALAVPAVMLATALSNFGLTQAIVQKPRITHLEVNTLFWASSFFALIITAALALLSFPLAAWFDQPELLPVAAVSSIAVLFSTITGQYLGISRRRLQIRNAELLLFFSQLTAAVLAIVAGLIGLSYWAMVIQLVAAPVLSSAILPFMTGWRPSRVTEVDIRQARHSFTFGGYVAGCSILNQVATFAGTYIVRGSFNITDTGLFYRSRNVANLVESRVTMPLSSAFVPALSRLQSDPVALDALFSRLLTRASLIVMPIGVVMAVASESLTRLFLGEEWSAAAPLMFWMSLFAFRAPAYSVLQDVTTAMGKGFHLFFVALIRCAVVIGAMLLAARFGLVTMTAIGILAELLVILPLMCLVALRTTPLRLKTILRDCWIDILLAIAIAGVLRLTLVPVVADLADLPQLLILSAAIGLIYAARIALSAEMRRDLLRIAGRFLPGTRLLRL